MFHYLNAYKLIFYLENMCDNLPKRVKVTIPLNKILATEIETDLEGFSFSQDEISLFTSLARDVYIQDQLYERQGETKALIKKDVPIQRAKYLKIVGFERKKD